MLDFIHLWEVGTKSPWIQKLRYFCPYSAGARTHSASQFAEGQTDNRYCSIHHWKCLQWPHESQNWTMEQQKEREEVWGNVLLGNLVSEFLLMVLCVKSKLLITISLSGYSVFVPKRKKRDGMSQHIIQYTVEALSAISHGSLVCITLTVTSGVCLVSEQMFGRQWVQAALWSHCWMWVKKGHSFFRIKSLQTIWVIEITAESYVTGGK